ncbi:phage terminase small subunit P27 family [Streptomyces sp. NBC_00291]|uniref:phage terminase small subunit P27 family n=1 Tax=Streptomyces sp. NBC_00291 TaxID=2975704 RepID=UPI002258A3AC|nr:phage terminase small subunit P27 family [Streptomyces sp. NBC_00291]MCX5153691.1 phage terminase small subunit P27 family [Streptomyces sp. NBC_00291]
MTRAKSPAQRTGNANTAATPDAAPVVYEGRAPRVPTHLRGPGREVWRAVWQAGGGAYSPETDRNVILRYAELHDRRADLLDLIHKEGLSVVGSTGQPAIHPAMRYVESTERELRAIENAIGFTPEARMRLGIVAAEARRVAASPADF